MFSLFYVLLFLLSIVLIYMGKKTNRKNINYIGIFALIITITLFVYFVFIVSENI